MVDMLNIYFSKWVRPLKIGRGFVDVLKKRFLNFRTLRVRCLDDSSDNYVASFPVLHYNTKENIWV